MKFKATINVEYEMDDEYLNSNLKKNNQTLKKYKFFLEKEFTKLITGELGNQIDGTNVKNFDVKTKVKEVKE
jgi:hypothetical protein